MKIKIVYSVFRSTSIYAGPICLRIRSTDQHAGQRRRPGDPYHRSVNRHNGAPGKCDACGIRHDGAPGNANLSGGCNRQSECNPGFFPG